jgi:hypothetical protein
MRAPAEMLNPVNLRSQASNSGNVASQVLSILVAFSRIVNGVVFSPVRQIPCHLMQSANVPERLSCAITGPLEISPGGVEIFEVRLQAGILDNVLHCGETCNLQSQRKNSRLQIPSCASKCSKVCFLAPPSRTAPSVPAQQLL